LLPLLVTYLLADGVIFLHCWVTTLLLYLVVKVWSIVFVLSGRLLILFSIVVGGKSNDLYLFDVGMYWYDKLYLLLIGVYT